MKAQRLLAMKARFLFFSTLLLTAVLFTECNDTKVDLELGVGSITYEGNTYPLDFTTLSTYPAGEGYTHTIIVTNTGNGNHVFSFSMKDNVSANEISPGEYPVSLNGDYTARFSIEEVSDSLSGTMIVTRSGDGYTLAFEGTTVDENSESKRVVFAYTGKLKSVNK